MNQWTVIVSALSLIIGLTVSCKGRKQWPTTPDGIVDNGGRGASFGQTHFDLDVAKAAAKQRNLPILLNFTDTKSCSPCQMMEQKVFSTKEWNTYAKSKLVVFIVELQFDRSLIPQEQLRENIRLSKKFGISATPTYVLLDSDGETILKQFNLRETEMDKYGFIKTIGIMLRNKPEEKQRFMSNLPQEQVSKYRQLLNQKEEVRSNFESWLETQPQRKQKNRQILEKYREKLSNLESDIQKMESLWLVRSISGEKDDRNAETLKKARDYNRVLQSIEKAKANLESWVLGRPEKNKQNQEIFERLMNKLNTAIEEMNQLD